MTPDLDAIRAALTAATPDVAAYDFTSSYYAGQSILANAPVWLAELCDEIERLRADLCSLTQETELEREQWRSSMTIRSQHIASLRRHHDELQVVRTERDAALAEVERLRALCEAKS